MLELHCCPLTLIDTDLQMRYRALLSGVERQRFAKFRRDEAAQAFVVSRALLRSVLAEKLNCTPLQLRFTRDANDKPQLADAALQFNLSHCRDWIALAISDGGAVGVDIEVSDRNNNLLGIARRFFQRDEAELLEALPEAQRAEKFCDLWTIKEACVKWSGLGIGRAIAGVGVHIERDRIALSLREDLAGCGRAAAQLYALPDGVRLACVFSADAVSSTRVFQTIPLAGSSVLPAPLLASSYPP